MYSKRIRTRIYILKINNPQDIWTRITKTRARAKIWTFSRKRTRQSTSRSRSRSCKTLTTLFIYILLLDVLEFRVKPINLWWRIWDTPAAFSGIGVIEGEQSLQKMQAKNIQERLHFSIIQKFLGVLLLNVGFLAKSMD